MIFAVSFSTRPLDYFLPPPAQRGGRLSATHDSATRGAGDTVPTEHIFSIIDLRLALSRIHEAAIARYPRPVAEVFAVVHAASLAEALDHAPQDPVHAKINLYTYGFTKLFEAIREYNYAPSLVPQTRGILSHYAAGYIRLIHQVLEMPSSSRGLDSKGTDPTHHATRTTVDDLALRTAVIRAHTALPYPLRYWQR
ncbi:hypothetical protein PC129_g9338 [Phytophthora cactorum]|uniref:Uncharacterized protein n=1 Tax=Phytophthora cactorum TaxID=29920 RepID=A0A8T1I744_9STRA|nr:hypothetical protein Pcac1_g7981 [Phytophthora cactorum]KAG2813082.1 hypothetical protein PC112_g14878 [Phytophthora cactorum]KAG2893484.1 hypothetical protein PC114_g16242 [Phytophthora cactorum]KAG2923622.1 hypothetical protein PC117_g15677 [Phytophthora cactorum]KAG3003734.1 hypothetical protein PC119_g15841 [Phytophthora cactorum]